MANSFTGHFSSKAKEREFMAITTSVADNQFENERGLTSISLPNVTSIGWNAFSSSKLTSLSLPKVTSIGDYAFDHSQLTSLDLPNITSIGYDAFSSSKLTSLSIPNVTSIKTNAFYYSKLTSLYLPKVTFIGNYAFKNSNLPSLDLPNVTSIGDEAFKNSKLTSLSLPNVTSIGHGAFENSPITSFYLPKVTSIGVFAFSSSKLTSLNLPKVTSIGDGAFKSSPLTYLNIPKITFVGYGASTPISFHSIANPVAFSSIVNLPSTKVIMPGGRDQNGVPFNSTKYKNEMFGLNNWNNIDFVWILASNDKVKMTIYLNSGKINLKSEIVNNVPSGAKYIVDPKIQFEGDVLNKFNLITHEDFKTFTTKPEIDLSEATEVISDRKIIFPHLPETLSAISKVSNNADISTSTDKDLKYLLKLPLNYDEFQNLFIDKSQRNGEKEITYSGHELKPKINKWTKQEVENEVVTQILSVYADAWGFSSLVVPPKGAGNNKIVDAKKYLVGAKFESQKVKKLGFIPRGNKIIKETRHMISRDKGFENFIQSSPLVFGIHSWTPWYGIFLTVASVVGAAALTVATFMTGGLSMAGAVALGATAFGAGVTLHENQEVAWFRKAGSGHGQKEQDKAKELFKQAIVKYYKLKDPNDINLQNFTVSKSVKGGGWSNFEYKFHITRWSFSNFSITFKTDLPSYEVITRSTTFDRAKWNQLIKSALDTSKPIIRSIDLKEKYSTGQFEIFKISISSIFGNKVWLRFKDGTKVEIPLNQSLDPTDTTTSIYFY